MKDYLNIPEDFDNLEKYAPVLAGINKHNPFGVPEGYFDENERFLESMAKLSFLNIESGFIVPPNYFEELPGIIQNRIMLSESETNTVPEGYFDELPNIIQSKIFLEGLNKANAFKVPENYFEDLADNIQSNVLIESLPKENPFTVPGGYFEELPALISARAITEKPVKVISLFRRSFTYVAAAASVALVIGLSFFFNRSEPGTLKANSIAEHAAPALKEGVKEYLLENVDGATLIEYASANNANVKIEVKTEGIEKKDVINYLLENNVDVNEL